MTEHEQTPEPAQTATEASRACDEAVVKRRAKAGLVTIAVAVVVAAITLLGAGATLLVTGLVPLPGLEDRIAAAISERLGADWTVTLESAELGRIDGSSQLRVRQVSFRHVGGASFRAPEAVLGYQPLALLRGEIRLVSVDLRSVNVRLGVDRDGALVMNADEAPIVPAAPVVVPTEGQWTAFTGIMNAVATLAKGDGLLGSLETAGMQGARLALVDPDGVQKAGLDDVDIRLSRIGDRRSRLTMKGRTGSRWKEFSVDVQNTPDGAQEAEIDILRFEPAEAAALAFGEGSVRIDGLAMTGKVRLSQAADGKRALKAALDLAPGVVRLPAGPTDPVAIDSAHVEIESALGLDDLVIRTGAFRMGQTRFEGTGSLKQENGAWAIKLDAKGQLAGAPSEPPVVLDRLQGDLVLDPQTSLLTVTSLALRGPAIQASLSGSVQRVGDGLSQSILARATDADARAVLAIWPGWTSPDLHASLSRQIVAGRVAAVEVKINLSAEAHAQLYKGAGMPEDSLLVSVDANQVQFQPALGLPLLVDAVVTGQATGRTVQLAIAKASADMGAGRRLALSEGSFAIADSWVPRAPARIAFRSIGPVEAVAAVFTFPALKEFAPGALDPAAVRGQSDLRTSVTLPMVPDPQPGEVVVQSSGSLTGVASDTLLGTEKLDNGTFALNFDRSGLTVRGDARVGGDKAQIEIRQNAKGQGEATLVLALDNAARQRRGIGPEAGITGPTPAKATKTFGKGADQPPRIEIDLSKAAIDGLLPGFSKAAGKPGRVSFTYVADADGPDLEDFVLEAAPVLIKGKIELNKQNALESASLSQVRLSPGDNLKVEAKRDGNLTKLVVRGAVGDVRPFIRDMQNATSAVSQGGRSTAKTGDLDLDLDVPILTGFNNEAIGNGVLKLSRRGGDIRSLNFQGRIGKADVTARQGRQGDVAGSLIVQSENGGALLRFLDLYRRAYGGDLVLTIGPGDTPAPEKKKGFFARLFGL